MSRKFIGRRALLFLMLPVLIAGVLFLVAAETGMGWMEMLLVGGLTLGGFLAAPILTLVLFALLFTPTYLLLRSRVRRRGVLATITGGLAAVAAIGISLPIHGESFSASTMYQVPVQITLEPSDAAYEYLYTPGTLGVRYWWSDVDEDCTGEVSLDLNSRVGTPRRPQEARPIPRRPYRFVARVRYRNKLVGAAQFHWAGTSERVRIHMPNLHISRKDRRNALSIPIRKGEQHLELVDRRGCAWSVHTKTLDDRARFVRVGHHWF